MVRRRLTDEEVLRRREERLEYFKKYYQEHKDHYKELFQKRYERLKKKSD